MLKAQQLKKKKNSVRKFAKHTDTSHKKLHGQHVNSYSTSAIRKVQTKTTMKYHYPHINMK